MFTESGFLSRQMSSFTLSPLNFRSTTSGMSTREPSSSTVASLAIYLDNNVAHRTVHPAAVWVAVPPASVLLTALALTVAGIFTKKKSRSDD